MKSFPFSLTRVRLHKTNVSLSDFFDDLNQIFLEFYRLFNIKIKSTKSRSLHEGNQNILCHLTLTMLRIYANIKNEQQRKRKFF